MNAEIISVGTELLLGTTVDTNAATMGEILAQYGVGCTHRQTVGDNLERLTEALRLALSRADVVITIGGLGPTQDDLTREAIALALGDRLRLDRDMEATIRAIFERRGLKWVASNIRQAMRPESGQGIPNPHGTAPGLVCRKDGKVLFALPGPPREFGPMAKGAVAEFLREMTGGRVIHSRILRVCGLGESRAEELLSDLMQGENPSLAPYAKTMEVHLRVTAAAESVDAAERMIEPVAAEVRRRLGSHVYGEGETNLEAALISSLSKQGLTVCVAESCTGGMLGSRLSSLAGASRVFLGGLIAYDSALKVRELGVSESLLREQTAVSEAVAIAMAEGARQRWGTDFALAITGVAGPGPDADGNAEGLVFVALRHSEGVKVVRYQFGAGRENIRLRATQQALVLLWEHVSGGGA